MKKFFICTVFIILLFSISISLFSFINIITPLDNAIMSDTNSDLSMSYISCDTNVHSYNESSHTSEFKVIDNVIYSSDGKTLYKYNSSNSDFFLPETVLYIAPNAFRGSGIKNIHFNDKLIYIGCKAFYNTDIESVFLPDSVKLIDYNAFVGCTAANNGYIPSGCHSIYGFRPYNCVSDTVFVAPFYTKNYNDTDFPCQVVLSDESIFMKSNRDFSLVNSPGSSEDSPYDWKEKYFEMPVLESLSYDCDFILVDKNTGILVFTSWLNKTNVFVSNDGGITWYETPSAPIAISSSHNSYAGSIWLNPDIGLLYYDNIITGRFMGDSDEQLVQITTDGGNTWTMLCRHHFILSTTPNGFFDLPYTSVSYTGDYEKTIIGFVSAEGNLYEWISYDNGTTWIEYCSRG